MIARSLLVFTLALWALLSLVLFAEAQGPPRAETALPVFPGDRLVSPTPAGIGQADEGAQLYWLHCQPCHGDQGQGLTDEWRAQYPPEEQYCWEAGCHSDQPYEGGFTLPMQVPPLIGDDSLSRFEDLAQLHAYVSAAMPYQDPGHLTAEEYLALAAFLAYRHDIWDGRPMTADRLAQFRLRPEAATTPTAAGTPAPPPAPDSQGDGAGPGLGPAAAAGAVLLFAGGVWLWRRSRG
jgi:cytochrome c